jgi:diphosphomevalonate decarboxylase
MRAAGTLAFATIDAGPHVKVLVTPADAVRVREALVSLPAVRRIIEARPGDGARLTPAAGARPGPTTAAGARP